ncbi:MAG TPA: ATP-dependent Clp protease proteolytic subunit [Myxococcota bacterium]|nr:ATP-dependent Clp protease proteolytic subunit [Myxococcota bacterium]HOA13999.1 ATP-dependent Clp protease proteolytic subunit [Myxococcota bacterium]HOC98936.1 ATP-dependent Clp protease proteolytic subunit [Myxococcota bacterium]HOH77092.1 ATP-dependent Clp protease proteolytic subunit [Myxococcota bacterium]HPV04204.1 ATP-dependent Clp protease proteolytic subunit [Myxococcota bacterium]
METGCPEREEKGEQGSPAVQARLFDNRTIVFGSEVSPKTATALIEQLLAMDAADPAAPITLFLNSPGGEVNSGFAIYDVIRFIRPPVRIVCTGLSASIAAIILLAARPEHRLAMANARLLLHQPLYSGDVIGPASDLEITANEILKSRARINSIIASATGRDPDQVGEDTQRDFWLTAPEAVEYGLVSRIVSSFSELG